MEIAFFPVGMALLNIVLLTLILYWLKRRGFLITATDIRKLRELANVASEKTKRAVVMDSIKDGVLSLNHERKVQMANPAALKMLRMTSPEILDHLLGTIITLTNNQADLPIAQLLPNQVETAQPIVNNYRNVKVTTRAGHIFWADVSGYAIQEQYDVDLQSIFTLHDLTEEQHLENMKSDFVSMAAHELKTPLTSLNGYLEFLLMDEPKTLTAVQREFATRAQISASRLTKLVISLLDASKIENNKIDYCFEPLEWNSLVAAETDAFRAQAEAKGLTLSFVPLKDEQTTLLADPLRIKEVLSNLLSNAIYYTQTGEIDVRLERDGETLITHISDTGRGIAADSLPKLFTKFFRVSERLVQNSQGTGLGLYISKRIIEDHHGMIWVESQPDKGSTFSFSLPLVNTLFSTLLTERNHKQ